MTGVDSQELIVRLKRIVELSEKLLESRAWNDETRHLTHLIRHELALAEHQLRLSKPDQN
jgi:hypothetical protein